MNDSNPEDPARFALGRLAITPAAQTALDAAGTSPLVLLARHVQGDWGDLSAVDATTNELGLLTGLRLLSSYPISVDKQVWIITEADRATTTILLPDDY